MAPPPGAAGSGRDAIGSFADGRDELNLADFPISVLQKQQPREPDGRKRDQAVFETTTYDPRTRRRVPQRVTLTTSSRCGLPTPADENVILALLYISKHTNNFGSPRVHFSPLQLFRIMRWDGNSRSYARLGQVLLRLKSLTLLYENAWWDASGRRYEEEFATGIVAEYRLIKSRIRRKPDELPPSYVHWTPHFHGSLANGNLKKLDLDRLFALSTPLAQRMYRFLDKRFYATGVVEMDLRELVCGHLGATESPNVAELKRRIAPAIAELEASGFLEPLAPDERFVKLRKGIWRVRFRRAGASAVASGTSDDASTSATRPGPVVLPSPTDLAGTADLVRAFYEAWSPGGLGASGPIGNDLARARGVVERFGAAGARALVPRVVALMRRRFPAAKRFGAALPYFEEVGAAAKAGAVRGAGGSAADETRRILDDRRRQAERRRADDEAFLARWEPAWQTLAEAEREAIRAAVLQAHPWLAQPLRRHAGLAHRFYLEELARRSDAPATAGPGPRAEDGPGPAPAPGGQGGEPA